jgi:Zn-dependent peptidase ImmA (M78 family)/DNA-binding XRE family transcriptional regulator
MEMLHSIAHRFNPQALTVAREFRGLMKADLAKDTHVTPSAISQLEAGKIKPTAATVAALSMALGFPPRFFATAVVGEVVASIKEVSSDRCHFRSLRSSSQSERRQMVATASLLHRLVEFLDRHIDFPAEQLTSIMLNRKATKLPPEELAGHIRQEWGLGIGPIANMVQLLEAKGVLVFRVNSECPRVDAFSLWHEHRPYIFLNTEKGSSSRSRFDAAHEFGHLLMHPDCVPGDPQHEREANRFASAFLLPQQSFLGECPPRFSLPILKDLKMRWKVSLRALIYRAHALGLYSEATYRRANSKISLEFGVNEPLEPSEEHSVLIKKAIDTLSSAGISFSQIAESIAIHEGILRGLLEASGRKQHPEVKA